MAKPFQHLRGLITDNGDTQEDAAHAICLGVTAFSQKMNSRREWTIGEMYGLMDRYNAPYDQLHYYFPKYGRNE